MKHQQLFNNRVGILATMHQKERVIAPLMKQELGIKIVVPHNFNSDIFGTFTRDVNRPGTQIVTARLKAEKALDITGETLAIASEGIFAPHPSFPYIYSNRELVILLDRENDLEIIGEEFSTETNFNHQVVENLQEAKDFARKVGFPEHGLVVWFSESTSNCSQIIKGIITKEKFVEAINLALNNSPDSKVHLETDMRALYNPTRMKNIEKATRNLIEKINNHCPKCSTPGWEITQRIPGLPCAICSMPTTITRAVIYQCKKCGFSEEKLVFDEIKFAGPAQCMYCNP
jgi:hypothetical protein